MTSSAAASLASTIITAGYSVQAVLQQDGSFIVYATAPVGIAASLMASTATDHSVTCTTTQAVFT